MNERLLSNLTDGMRNDLKKHTLGIATNAQKVVDTATSETFQRQAFAGGARDYFQSELEIKRHYDAQRADARARGEAELERLLEEFNATMRVYLRLDTDVLAAAQAKLSLAGLSDADIMRIAEGGRDSYSTLRAVASYGITSGNKYAKVIAAHLRDFESAVSAVPEKTEKFVKKGLRGDKYCADSWHDWIMGRIDAIDEAYQSLQNAVDGNAALSFADTVLEYLSKESA